VTDTVVLKRMKLGRVSPVILDLFRQGDITLAQVEAFTVSDDYAKQEQVWRDLPSYSRHPGSIRHALTEGEIAITDRRVALVTLEAYEAAGGEVRRDLFDAQNGGYIVDTALLDRLVLCARDPSKTLSPVRSSIPSIYVTSQDSRLNAALAAGRF
jgi:ParB family chromosome partitioning protein